MVHFEKDRYVIDIFTGSNPVEDYLALQQEIAYVFSMLTPENLPATGLYNLATLLANMQPCYETAVKMTK